MTYNLSSERLSHPLLKPILQVLASIFEETGVRFYVIGAMARDLVMELHKEASARLTHDLDIAIAIDDWAQFKMVESALFGTGKFTKDRNQLQRFYFEGNFVLDIVPFGEIMKQDDKIYWPPEESIAMTVLGFDEVQNATLKIEIDGEFVINVASLAGIFILKIMAWKDRHSKTKKDAEDLGFIMINYLSIYESRALQHYDEVYTDDFTILSGGAIVLGKDLAEILPKDSAGRKSIIELLESQINKSEESVLLSQIIETNRSLRFHDIYISLQKMLNELIK